MNKTYKKTYGQKRPNVQRNSYEDRKDQIRQTQDNQNKETKNVLEEYLSHKNGEILSESAVENPNAIIEFLKNYTPEQNQKDAVSNIQAIQAQQLFKSKYINKPKNLTTKNRDPDADWQLSPHLNLTNKKIFQEQSLQIAKLIAFNQESTQNEKPEEFSQRIKTQTGLLQKQIQNMSIQNDSIFIGQMKHMYNIYELEHKFKTGEIKKEIYTKKITREKENLEKLLQPKANPNEGHQQISKQNFKNHEITYKLMTNQNTRKSFHAATKALRLNPNDKEAEQKALALLPEYFKKIYGRSSVTESEKIKFWEKAHKLTENQITPKEALQFTSLLNLQITREGAELNVTQAETLNKKPEQELAKIEAQLTKEAEQKREAAKEKLKNKAKGIGHEAGQLMQNVLNTGLNDLTIT